MNAQRRNAVRAVGLVVAALTFTTAVLAHDGWVQTNVTRTSQGEMVYLDMQFGNHGNMHRDYKIHASKWDKAKSLFWLHTPGGERIDFSKEAIDIGADTTVKFCDGATTYTDKNGYLVASFQAEQQGLYIVDVEQDTVVSYAPERSIKCAKAMVGSVAPSAAGNYAAALSGFGTVLGQIFEIVPKNDPTKLAVGDTLTFQVLFKGTPLADADVSVIPRGKTLPEMGQPNPYDKMTDPNGMVSYTFTEANYHLIVAHHHTDEAGTLDGKTYTNTKYTADLTAIIRPKRPGI